MKILTKIAASACMLAAIPAASQAMVTVDVSQVGANVVVTTSGSLDLTGYGGGSEGDRQAGIDAAAGTIVTGAGGGVGIYLGFLSGPSSFGGGTGKAASASSGATFGVDFETYNQPTVFAPYGYVDGTSLSGDATFLNKSLASLGLTANKSYEVDYIGGATAIEINVEGTGAAAVPEPATWMMLIVGFVVVGAAIRRRPRATDRLASV